MKKKFSIIFVMIFIINICTFNTYVSKAEENIKGNKILNVSARAAIAMDAKSGVVLYEKNPHMIVPMASTTKIITSLVALKYGDLNKKVEISDKAAKIKGSTVGYKKGELITIKELLYGLMFRSGNDAAIAISEGVAGSVDEFLKLMNEYAREIGLLDTNFESPHGLDSERHYSTAYDLALATAKAKQIEFFSNMVGDKEISAEEHGFTRSYNNINKILWRIPEANGVKTGYTGNAGKCLVSSVNCNRRDIVIVVLNCTERWKETERIYKYVMDNYEYKSIVEGNKALDSYKVKGGNKALELIRYENLILPIKKGTEFSYKIIMPKGIEAPINKGQSIGRLDVFQEETLVYSEPLYSKESIEKKIISKSWRDIFRKKNK